MRLGLRELIYLSLMAAAFAGAYVAVFGKASAECDALRADTAAKEKAVFDLNRSTAGVDQMQQKTAALAQSVAEFHRALPQEAEIDSIIEGMPGQVSANSLTLVSMNSRARVAVAGYAEQPVDLVVTGDFNGLYAFLLQLERLPGRPRVTQLAIEKVADRDGGTRGHLSFSLFFTPPRAGTAVAITERD